MNQRLTALLHQHFSGLLEFSDLDESNLLRLSEALTALEAPDSRAVQRELELSELTFWRLASGDSVWDNQSSATAFLQQVQGLPVDAWREGRALVSQCLVAEIVRAL